MINAQISRAAAALAQTLSLQERTSLAAAVNGAETVQQIKAPWQDKISDLIDRKKAYESNNLNK